RQAPAQLVAALEQSVRTGIVERLELDPLTEAEAEELLGAQFRPPISSVLYRESGGNPFYLEELARAARRPGQGHSRAAAPLQPVPTIADAEVPPAVRVALAEELALLSEEARKLVDGAAVVGDPFQLPMAAEAAGVDLPVALEALDEL